MLDDQFVMRSSGNSSSSMRQCKRCSAWNQFTADKTHRAKACLTMLLVSTPGTLMTVSESLFHRGLAHRSSRPHPLTAARTPSPSLQIDTIFA